MSQSLKQKTLNNVSYNAISKVIAFAFQSGANIIITRELTAADYGVVGFAMICVTFMKSFSGLGINSAAIHEKEFDAKGISTAFTLRLILGLIVFLATIALSGIAEYFIEHKEITSIMRVIAFAIIIDSLSSVSSILLARKLQYSLITIADAGLAISSSIIAVVMALNGYGYWSIVYSYIAANVVFTVIIYALMPYSLKLGFDKEIAYRLLTFGSKVFMTALLAFFIMNMDNFIIGSVAGAAQLGFYAIAFNWGTMVCSILGAIVFGVLFPTFSKMQDDPERMKQSFLKILEYTALISVLCNIGLFCVGENFLVSVLGKGTDKWLPSLHALQVICLYGVLRSLVAPASSFFMAQIGSAHIPLKGNLIVAVVELVLVYPAIKYGNISIVAIAVLLAYICQLTVYLPALRQLSNITAKTIWSKIWPAIMSGISMILCYQFWGNLFQPTLWTLTGSIVILTGTYILVYGILTRWKIFGQLRELLPATR